MHKLAIALLGDPTVGKTSLVRRFVLDEFSDGYMATVGAKPMKKNLQLQADGRTEDIQLLVWDVVGQRGYHGVQDQVLKGIQGVLLMYDVNRDETRESLATYWIPRLTEAKLRVPIVVAGNKLDLSTDRWAALDGLKRFAGDSGLSRCFLTSAKTGERVEDAFGVLAAAILGGAVPSPPVVRNGRPAQAVDPMVSVVDQVITDFCDEYGGPERAMFHVQREAARAGLDINAPNWDAVRLFINNLYEIDRGLRVAKAADAQARRLLWLWEAANASPL